MQTQKTLLDQMVTFFLSAFRYPGLDWKLILLAVGLGLVFGAVWLSGYRPGKDKSRPLLIIVFVSAILTWTAIAFIQVPLQYWSGRALLHFWDQFTILRWLYLAGIPSVLLSGLVQEGAKMVPMVAFWLKNNRVIDARTGLIIGAVSGAGFGVFEAIWVHNTIFASGWTWQMVHSSGYTALLGFQERFFTVGFHIAVSALAGYGLATKRGWQFYLVASFLHGLTNYAVILLQKGVMNHITIEVYIAVLCVALTAWVLRLRWRPEPA